MRTCPDCNLPLTMNDSACGMRGADPMTSRGASALPWYADMFGNVTTHPPRRGFKALLPTGGIVAKVKPEDAALIVQAVNSHAELVEALEELLAASNWEPSEPMTSEATHRIAVAQGKAQNALARARGGK